MNQIAETEQWLLDGDCDKCRKEKYCSKECTAFKKYLGAKFKNAMDKAMKRLVEERKEKGQNEKENSNDINNSDDNDNTNGV